MNTWVIVLTFVVQFQGASVEQKLVRCPDVACVDEIREQAWQSPTCQRFRLWPEDNFSTAHGLRTFINPPVEDWSKV
jgi:hypothetical protein